MFQGLLLQPTTARSLQGASRTLLHIRQDVGVGVKGYGNSSVPQHLRDDVELTLLDKSSVAHVCRRS